jgi:hypothetical protein
MQSGGSVPIFLIFIQFILPQLAKADLQDIHDSREDAMMAAQTTNLEDAGYKRECEKTTNTAEEYTECARRLSDLAKEKAAERKRNASVADSNMTPSEDPSDNACDPEPVIRACTYRFEFAQKHGFTRENINLCRTNCSISWARKKIGGCEGRTKEDVEENLKKRYSYCALAAPSKASFAVDGANPQRDMNNYYSNKGAYMAEGAYLTSDWQRDPDNTRILRTCVEPGQSDVVAVCNEKIDGMSNPIYGYRGSDGKLYGTREEALATNKVALNTSGLISPKPTLVTLGGGPSLQPKAAVVVPKVSGAGGGGGMTTGGSTTGSSTNDPLVNSSTTDQTSADNQNIQTASVSDSSMSGSSSLGSGSSTYGDASMFPSLQSAKSYKSSDETTSGSGSSSFRGSSSSGSSGGYKSYSGGTGTKSTNNLGGHASEVAPAGRVYAPSGAISRGGASGTGSSGSLGNQGVSVASVSPNNENSQRVLHIGDQGFYKPGGSAVGVGAGTAGGKYAGGKNKRRKKLKSVGGCAPGNIQCVLASLGRTTKGTRVGHRKGTGSRLPAGVTSGVEDIFSRLEKFHNRNITLDHEGMIDNSDNGFDGRK